MRYYQYNSDTGIQIAVVRAPSPPVVEGIGQIEIPEELDVTDTMINLEDGSIIPEAQE